MSAALILEGQTLLSFSSLAWPCSASRSWLAFWWESPASPQKARPSSQSVVWMWWTSMLPALEQTCAAQAATGMGTQMGASPVCGARMRPSRPTTPPRAEPRLLEWQSPSSWGHSSSARASSSLWRGSFTSSAPVSSPGSSTGVIKVPYGPENLRWPWASASQDKYFRNSSGGLCTAGRAPALQPSEAAAMIPAPQSSVRKPRYVRRERPPDTSAFPAVDARISNV
ncbi:uncharacterized protein C1orf159 homolog isoform X2 [Heterocephalus glaber]|uniref:Uncharacterized protein C1orf159 homolog isoform X2 n=1 Tax=Heterocephalus glaber TaxID=10181 RepID=A0AAX6RR87_HETGA|nr:uncharacterized protein C1orf159 homolog isoform X2 [Heterocephalus glaber]